MSAVDRPLVVGVDGSESSLRAVDWAADEAVLRGLPLRLVHACRWERYESASLARDLGGPDEQLTPQDLVAAAGRRALAQHPALEVSSAVEFEEPEYALVHAGHQATALVVGTRGRGGVTEMLLGSVSLTVAAHADCPVIVLRGSHDNRATPPVHGRVVVGVGADTAAVGFAVAEARRRGVPLEAVRAWRSPARERTGPRATAPDRLDEDQAEKILHEALCDVPPDVDLRRRTVEGLARRVLVDASHRADLLVVGARRREGRHGPQLGRVAHAALHHSACPVAVVPQRG
ncbi:universal stress protein [Streptomyces sp. NPDC126514]|uniref:universal stress protein n=1 Tax=Streptomyces sp. NPDC126514 TaxID=3155210 RepID=UPI0033252E95